MLVHDSLESRVERDVHIAAEENATANSMLTWPRRNREPSAASSAVTTVITSAAVLDVIAKSCSNELILGGASAHMK